jgi:predicted PurR-regulated permease PerM
MNWNEFLEKTYLAFVKENMQNQSPPQPSHSPSELQKTIEYLGHLREQYRAEIRLFLLFAVFFLFYSLVRELTTLVLASYLVALLFDPVLRKMEKKGISRTKGVVLLYAVFTFVVLGILWMLVPRLAHESMELLRAVPGYAEGSVQKLKDFVSENFNLEIPASPAEVKMMVASITEGKTFESMKPLLDPLWRTLFAGYNVTLALINLFLFPFLVFYISRDWKLINGFLSKTIPGSYRDTIFPFLKDVQKVIAGYARGQVLVAILLTIAYSSVLLLLGVRFALPLGVFAGMLSVVPYLGYFTGFTLALIVQVVNDGTFLGILKLVLAFLAIQIVEGNFITPRVLGSSTGLHPLIVILSLIIAGTLFGFLGLLMGIPAAAILKLLLQRTIKPL